ncbi:MAG TPA: hypothetical protein VL943_00020, partial [Niabella sp.]|nr:hypothetical protein [Niabella sp.]
MKKIFTGLFIGAALTAGYNSLANNNFAIGEPQPPKHRAGIVLEEFIYTKADFPSCHSATILELSNG